MARRKKRKSKKPLNKFFQELRRDYVYWLAVVAWVVFILLLVGYFYLSSIKEYSNTSKSFGSRLVSTQRLSAGWVEIDYSNGRKRLFTGDFLQSFPLAMVLEAAVKDGTIKLTMKKGVIESVDGVRGRWAIYHGKKSVGSKLNGLSIKGGDKYTIKKEK